MNYKIDGDEVLHDIELGLRIHSDRVSRDQTIDTYDIVGGDVDSIDNNVDARRTQNTVAYATYLEDKIQIGRLTVSPGIRYEHLVMKWEDKESTSGGEGSMDVFAAGIGFLWQQSEQLSYYGGFNT